MVQRALGCPPSRRPTGWPKRPKEALARATACVCALATVELNLRRPNGRPWWLAMAALPCCQRPFPRQVSLLLQLSTWLMSWQVPTPSSTAAMPRLLLVATQSTTSTSAHLERRFLEPMFTAPALWAYLEYLDFQLPGIRNVVKDGSRLRGYSRLPAIPFTVLRDFSS